MDTFGKIAFALAVTVAITICVAICVALWAWERDFDLTLYPWHNIKRAVRRILRRGQTR